MQKKKKRGEEKHPFRGKGDLLGSEHEVASKAIPVVGSGKRKLERKIKRQKGEKNATGEHSNVRREKEQLLTRMETV